jgi:predicted methyltransferase
MKHIISGWLTGLTLIAAIGASADPQRLEAVLAGRSAEDRARDVYRHPAETLTFFQLEPGMTVAEALPGGGWYTRILAEYLGAEGTLYGVNYADRMWPMFGFSDEFVQSSIAATAAFPERVAEWSDSGVRAVGFAFGEVPEGLAGTADRVLLIRALHNLNRFEPDAEMRSEALETIYALLKPGGLLGVVQHRAPESHPDESVDGSRGYMKQSDVIAMIEGAGFTLLGTSEINANPKDRPGPSDIVWRLPPTLSGSDDDPEQRAGMLDIGESDRMTLLFRKPTD